LGLGGVCGASWVIGGAELSFQIQTLIISIWVDIEEMGVYLMETLYLIVAILVAIGGLGYFQKKQAEREGTESQRRFAVLADAVKQSIPPAEGLQRDSDLQLVERLASIERRMEALEKDALTYLRKGSQRYEMARKREKRLAEEELGADFEDSGQEETGPKLWPQAELQLNQGGSDQQDNGLSLSAIRRRMYTERG